MGEREKLGTLDRRLSDCVKALFELDDTTNKVFESEVLKCVALLQSVQKKLTRVLLVIDSAPKEKALDMLATSLNVSRSAAEHYASSSEALENLHRLGVAAILVAKHLNSDINMRRST